MMTAFLSYLGGSAFLFKRAENGNSFIDPAPFSNELEAIIHHNECAYDIKITLDDAINERAKRQIRVYADGVYDMFHLGHARQLMQAKNAFPNVYLIVGICNDKDTYLHKGPTVMNENERYEAMRHCRYVDEIIRDAPWSYGFEFLEKYKIDFVAHDDIPYQATDTEDVYQFLKESNRFLVTSRTTGVSTTDIISRIVFNYEEHEKKIISKGLIENNSNVGFFEKHTLRFVQNYEDLKERAIVGLAHLMDLACGYIYKRFNRSINTINEKYDDKKD